MWNEALCGSDTGVGGMARSCFDAHMFNAHTRIAITAATVKSAYRTAEFAERSASGLWRSWRLMVHDTPLFPGCRRPAGCGSGLRVPGTSGEMGGMGPSWGSVAAP
ncbi:hypothetical protein HOK021_41530 [Streptomyces hygroscopicus]|nr:hypothetical protein HOK021_41530 [Streptomyces hygroscopicus]